MKSRLLLDTCAVLYTSEGRLDARSTAAIDRAYRDGDRILVSAISAWEIGLLSARGRLPSTVPPLRYFESFTTLPGMGVAIATPEILVGASFLPTPVHRDPADRIIIATARALSLTIMTSDKLILDYASRGHVRAVECRTVN